MKGNTGKLIILLIAVIFLSSCLSVGTKITLNEEGGGTIELDYTVSPLIMNLGSLGEDDNFSPLPVSEEDFIMTAATIPGMTVENVESREDEEGVHISAVLNFESTSALSGFFALPEESPGIIITVGDNTTTFRYVVFQKPETAISEESMEMINAFFGDDLLTFEITPPAPIIDVNMGEIGGNGRTALFSVSISELFMREEEVVWEVRW